MDRNTWKPIPGSGKRACGIKNRTMPIISTAIPEIIRMILWELFFEGRIKVIQLDLLVQQVI
jgi:hypothetical protein